MTFSTPIHTNEQSFERVLATGFPLLLVWYRPKTEATAQLDKTLNQLAIRFEGQALIAKINAEDNPELTRRYKIQALPSLVFLRDGNEIARTSGALLKEQLQPALEALVNGQPIPTLAQQTSEAFNPEQSTSDGKPMLITDTNFQKVVSGKQPIFVDFWAEWCGPCRTLAPTIDALAKEFSGKAVVGKLNVDQNPRTAQMFNVRSIPTMIIFKGGRAVDQIVGVQSLQALKQRLQAQL